MENKHNAKNKHNNKNNKKKYRKQKENKRVSSVDLLEKRVIYLNGEIDASLAKEIINKLMKLDMCNHKDITLYINSPGGEVREGLAIYDVMNMIKSDIKTIGIGRCASMASILLINGTKGKRYILPNAEVMIHEVSSMCIGKIGEMQDKIKCTKRLNNRLYRIIAKNTKRSFKEIKEITNNKDNWMNANEALKYGFVDNILK